MTRKVVEIFAPAERFQKFKIIISRAERREPLFIKVKPYVAQGVGNC